MPNFDQKIFMFPESYNELRKELETHWNPNKTGIHPHHRICEVRWDYWQCGWAMAWDADIFVSYMNKKLSYPYNVLAVTNDDELRIGHICSIFLKELRKKRGESNP